MQSRLTHDSCLAYETMKLILKVKAYLTFYKEIKNKHKMLLKQCRKTFLDRGKKTTTFNVGWLEKKTCLNCWLILVAIQEHLLCKIYVYILHKFSRKHDILYIKNLHKKLNIFKHIILSGRGCFFFFSLSLPRWKIKITEQNPLFIC